MLKYFLTFECFIVGVFKTHKVNVFKTTKTISFYYSNINEILFSLNILNNLFLIDCKMYSGVLPDNLTSNMGIWIKKVLLCMFYDCFLKIYL